MQMISLPSRGIDYGGAEKRSKRSTILEKYLLYETVQPYIHGYEWLLGLQGVTGIMGGCR